MAEPMKNNVSSIEPGMIVEANEGDLGETDLSKPKVSKVIEDEAGNLEKIVVKKGVIFQKEIEVPAARIEKVVPHDDQANKTNGTSAHKVVIAASEAETEALSPVGTESLENENILDQVENQMPTAEGMRKLEEQSNSADKSAQTGPKTQTETKGKRNILKLLGPGFLGGMAGNDSSAVTAYSLDGAKNGFGHLWLLLLATPLYQAVQYTCAKVGRISQKGLSELLRENYGRPIAIGATLILLVANLALIAADLLAIGAGLELLTGLSWIWFVVPVAIFLWYVTVFHNFEAIKKIFILLSMVFVTYLITAVLSGADWGGVVSNTFIPHVDFGFASISSAVALLGATVSPYTMFWQVQGEKEEKREGSHQEQMKLAALDIGSGVISGNLIAYAIIVCTSATIYTHHQEITTAADAAKALEPLLGSFAKYLFAVGLIGAGLVAIPVLLASSSYALAGTLKLPAGLSKKPWQNEGFYLILTVALLAGVGVALLGLDPVQLMFWANVLNGVLSPIIVVFLFLVSHNRKIMGEHRVSWYTNLGLILIAILMFAATGLLFYGLFTGQG